MDEDLMAEGMQRTDASSMVVCAQCTGDNPRTGTTWSHQQKSTKAQHTNVSLRVAGAQWTDVDMKAEPICPNVQDPRET